MRPIFNTFQRPAPIYTAVNDFFFPFRRGLKAAGWDGGYTAAVCAVGH